MRCASILATILFSAGVAGCASEEVSPLPAAPVYPQQDVELVVDGLGITHVYAQSDTDAFFGSGYAMARDRLFQMELVRRRALGRTAEVFGDGSVTDDIVSRTMGFGRLGQADAARVRSERPEQAALIEAWVIGVNRRINEVAQGSVERPYGLRSTELDFVPEPWTIEQALAVAKVIAFGLGDTFEPEILATVILRLLPDTFAKLPLLMPAYDIFTTIQNVQAPLSAPPSGPYANVQMNAPVPLVPFQWSSHSIAPRMASNNWAVAGQHTDTGMPYIAGDPHIGLASPTELWPHHLSSVDGGGTLDVMGFSFVGAPTVQIGHNAHIGWTATSNFADAMDVWDVQVSGDFTQVLLGSEMRAIEPRSEVIRVRDLSKPVGMGDDVSVVIHQVPGFGVILPDEVLPVPRAILADGHLMFRWTGFEPTLESSGFLGLDRATNIEEFEQAVDLLDVGAINLVAADKNEIDYRVHAVVPDRGDPASHPMPWHTMQGDDQDSLWTRGNLPLSKLPHWRDPAPGYLVTANNEPFGFTADGNVENDPYYYGAVYANGFRAGRIDQRIQSVIQSGSKMTRSEMEDIQRDVYYILVDTMMPPLEDAIAAIGVDPDLDGFVGRTDLISLASRLSAWDRRFSRAQAEPLVFLGLSWFSAKRAFRTEFTPTIFDAIHNASPTFFMGVLNNVIANRFAEASMFTGGNVRVLLLSALDDTAVWLTQRFGSIDANYTYADMHLAEFRNPYGGDLDVPLFAVDGIDDTVNVSTAAFFDGDNVREQFITHLGSAYRMVIGFAEDGTPVASVNFPRGTSEDPQSPHFDDQQQAWIDGTHAMMPFKRADVDAQATDQTVLKGNAK